MKGEPIIVCGALVMSQRAHTKTYSLCSYEKMRIETDHKHVCRAKISKHGQQFGTSGWVRGRYRYLLLLRKSRRCNADRDRDLGKPRTDRRRTAEKLFVWSCLSFVWIFFFPPRSNNRLGLLIECSKLTCFAREKATWFLGREIDD